MSAQIDPRSSPTGLRAVASFEAFKGILVILLGIFLLIYHTRADEVTENLLYHLHIDTDARIGRVVLNAAERLSEARRWAIGGIAFSYSAVRFVEAWGLWNRRVWAEWFALLSGATYLPIELAKVAQRANWEHLTVFGVNLLIVLYMLWIRLREQRHAPVVVTST